MKNLNKLSRIIIKPYTIILNRKLLAGHRATPSAIGHPPCAGGPTAPQSVQQATKGLRPKRPSYAQNGSSILSEGGSDLAQIPLPERNNGSPSFQSPSRFPRGDVISTQRSLHFRYNRK